MSDRATRCLIISDFNTSNLLGLLANDQAPPLVAPYPFEFSQMTELLLDAGHECWRSQPEIALVWTRPEAVSESFAKLLKFVEVAPEHLIADIDLFAAGIFRLLERVSKVFVPIWVKHDLNRGLGIVDLTHPLGGAGALLLMNARLVEKLRSEEGVFLLDAQRWLIAVGNQAYRPQLWHAAKIPFSSDLFREAVRDLKAGLAALDGRGRKLIIVDLDDTLWGGMVGEVAWEELRLGGHDPIGEAFLEFQQALKNLSNRGIVLAIVSKNDEAKALEAIRCHPEMVLRDTDFAGWRINWNDKAQNIVELAYELNLGLESVVFIDDSAVERERVRMSLPQVLVPEWPGDKMLYAQMLGQLRCFDSLYVTDEDRARTQMLNAERRRRDHALVGQSTIDFTRSLDTRISIELLTRANLPRAAQLLNKTNQMNLSTRRLSAAQLWSWAHEPGHCLWTFRVSDRFGSAGLVALVSLQQVGDHCEILDFVLSCRVFGRKVEEAMLYVVIRHARTLGIATVRARYRPTNQNAPTLNFLERSGMEHEGGGCFIWNTDREYPLSHLTTLDIPEVI